MLEIDIHQWFSTWGVAKFWWGVEVEDIKPILVRIQNENAVVHNQTDW